MLPTTFAMRFAILTAVCLCLSFTTGCGELRDIVEKAGASQINGSTDEGIREMFDQANSQCPIKVDPITTLISVDRIDDQNFEYHYRVTDVGSRMLKTIRPSDMKSSMVNTMKDNAIAVAIAERDLSIQHIYEDNSGSHLLSYTINKQVLAGTLTPQGSEKTNPFATSTVSASSTDSVVAEPSATALPQAIREMSVKPATSLPPQKRPTRDNAAGVQGNPYL